MHAHRLLERLEDQKRVNNETLKAIVDNKRRNGGKLPPDLEAHVVNGFRQAQAGSDDMRLHWSDRMESVEDIERVCTEDVIRTQVIMDAVSKAEKFEISLVDFIRSELGTLEEVDETLKVLHEMDLIKMPYDLCYLEGVIDFDNLRPHRYAVLVRKLDDERGYEMLTFSSKVLPNTKGWEHPAMYHSGIFDPLIPCSAWVQSEDGDSRITMLTNKIVKWFLFLMCARGTSRVVVSAPEKLNRCRLKNRQVPIDGYTKVLIPGFVERLREDEADKAEALSGRRVEERKRPRLHWRRGHIRQQAYGAGRALHRPVFIEPQLIGHESEGRIYHLQYGQQLTSENLKERS